MNDTDAAQLDKTASVNLAARPYTKRKHNKTCYETNASEVDSLANPKCPW